MPILYKCHHKNYCEKRDKCPEAMGYIKEHCEQLGHIIYVRTGMVCPHWGNDIVIMEKDEERRQT